MHCDNPDTEHPGFPCNHPESAECGATYGDERGGYRAPAIICTLPAGHAGEHEAPTGDDDGFWVWA